MRKAIINKPTSKAHGKEVFIHRRRGFKYLCSFTEKGDTYFFNKMDLEFTEESTETLHNTKPHRP